MRRRQLVRVDRVFANDGQFGIAIIAQKPCTHTEIVTGGTENELVLWILYERGRHQARGVGL